MKLKNIILLILQLSAYNATCCNSTKTRYALVIKPVADLIGQTSSNSFINDKIPLSPINKKDSNSCPRLHQLLFNEVVKIVSETTDETLIETQNAYYQASINGTKQNKFKTLKKNLISLDHLVKHKSDIKKIPNPIQYFNTLTDMSNIITIIGPFYDSVTNKTYSAGTRFVKFSENEDFYFIYIYNSARHTFEETKIRKKLCLINQNYLNKKQQISNFVKLVKKWANLKSGFIPYVWGGSSFCTIYTDPNFIEKKMVVHKKELNYYDFNGYQTWPKQGFDCSGMIFRAAQICGMPFYFKNSTTIAQNLKLLTRDDEIENGDIIWIPGHVIVITDVKNNLLSEATDYSSGHGRVRETNLQNYFKNIDNYKQLKDVLFEKKLLQRLNKNGNIFQTINNFKILKINSIYN